MAKSEIYLDGTYLEKNDTWHTEDSPWKAQQILKILNKNQLQPSSVCEVGCGAGEVLNQLHGSMPRNVTFSGYEVSPQAYHLSHEREKERLEFHLQDLLTVEKKFDVVLIIDVIEHIRDFYGFLKGLREKGVYKIFHIPLDLSVQTVLRSKPILAGRKQVGHIHYFTKETALAALEDMGYKILDYFYTPGMIELPGKPFRSRLLNTFRKVFFKASPDLTARILGGYSLMILTR